MAGFEVATEAWRRTETREERRAICRESLTSVEFRFDLLFLFARRRLSPLLNLRSWYPFWRDHQVLIARYKPREATR